MNLLQQAQRYLSMGWSVIPIERKSKLPALKSWKEFQERLPTIQELQTWLSNSKDMNLAIITGCISKLVVVDVDTMIMPLELAQLNLISPISVKTGKGKHFYFRCEESIPSRTRIFENVDIRANGGYVIAPPSIHHNGYYYNWVGISPTKYMVPFLPEKAKEILKEKKEEIRNEPGWITESLEEMKNGNRDDTLFRVCSNLRVNGYSQSDAFTFLSPYAQKVDAIEILKEKIDNVWKRYESKMFIQGDTEQYRQREKPKIYSPGNESDYQEYCKRRERKSSLQGWEISTGMPKLDEMLCGLQRGEIYTIGARTGIGKTTLCLNITSTILSNSRRCLYLSTEMSFDSIWSRLQAIINSTSEFRRSNLFVSDIGNPSQEQLREMIREVKPDVLIFDHIQHLGDSITNRTQELSVMVKALKNMAREFDLVVIVASQLNRGADSINLKTGDKIKPQLYHLKECGSIEEESTAVLLLNKEYQIDDNTDMYCLNVAKNRYGVTGQLEIKFDKNTMRMSEN